MNWIITVIQCRTRLVEGVPDSVVVVIVKLLAFVSSLFPGYRCTVAAAADVDGGGAVCKSS